MLCLLLLEALIDYLKRELGHQLTNNNKLQTGRERASPSQFARRESYTRILQAFAWCEGQ